MGNTNNRQGHEARRWQAAIAWAAACVCATALAQRAPAKAEAAARKAEPAVRAAPGVLVQFEEKRDTHILYLEEKGGMVTSTSAIVGESREAPAAAIPGKAAPPAAAPARR